MYFIGIDLGTSAVKLLLVDEKGNVKNVVSREYELSFPKPGWSEQMPEDWWRETIIGIKELIKDVDKNEIKGIGTAGQMHGLVILDENDNVIRPAILWNDGRSSKETDYLNNAVGKEKLTKWTGNIAFAGFTAPKILWVRDNEKENFNRIKKIMLPKDYINYKLTGIFATDYSDAAGMLLLDVMNKTWSKEMIDVCNIKEEMLPILYESFDVIGSVKEDVAALLGLNHNVKVVAGAADNAAAAVGTGTVGEGAANISIGTSGTVFISSKNFKVDSGNALHAFAHCDGNYHLLGCMLSAASCYKWWMEEILLSDDFDKESKMIDEKNLGENNVFYLPYLMGERAPHNDPFARSCFIGMTLDTKRQDLTQSIFEGVAFGIKDSFEAARNLGIVVQKSMVCGGGAKNELWLKMFANILNVELTVPMTEQGPGYGTAILAMVGDGVYKNVKDACDSLIKIKRTIKPEKYLVEKYAKKYEIYKSLYPALKDVFRNKLVN